MDKPRIYNADTDIVPSDAVLVDRTTPWGNPYRVGPDGGFEQVKKLYIDYLIANPELVSDIRQNLKGKSLVCWCVPDQRCHAEILIRLANDQDFRLFALLQGQQL
jgi:hypothetical protein